MGGWIEHAGRWVHDTEFRIPFPVIRIPPFEAQLREKREKQETFKVHSSETQGQNLAGTDLHVPHALGSGPPRTQPAGPLPHMS